MIRYPLYIFLLYFLLSCQERDPSLGSQGVIPDVIDYNWHIRPILSDRCFPCHGPDANRREASLRLDQDSSAFAELTDHSGHFAIVPFHPNRSEVISRITSNDDDLMMPPPDSKLDLTDREKVLLRAWIDQGAKYQDHWAFVAPSSPTIPSGVHPVDYFAEKRRDDLVLKSNPLATKESLIRRAFFDLTGLPPTLEDVDKFLADGREDAFDLLVDRLLADSAYGERMAADWMDVARYADSDGYLDDKHRDLWPWRDWVIEAFNQNMPYDQFITWQLAGDLLPDASQNSRLATAFNRLHRRNSEAGIVFEEYRVEYVADRVHTMSKAMLGLTMECARCHDHKYDPISQQEYYQLFAFFNSTAELGTAVYGPMQTPGPSMLLSSGEQQEILRFLDQEINEQTSRLREHQSSDPSPLTHISNRVIQAHAEKLVAHYTFDELQSSTGKQKLIDIAGGRHGEAFEANIGPGIKNKAFFVEDYNYILLGDKVGWKDRHQPFTISLWVKPARKYEHAGLLTHCEDLRLGYKGYGLHLKDNHLRFVMAYSWPNHSIEILSKDSIAVGKWSHVAISYDGTSQSEGLRIFINGNEVDHQVISNQLYRSILYEPDIHTYGFHGMRLGYRDKIKLFKGGAIDEVRIFDENLSSLEVLYDHQGVEFLQRLNKNDLKEFLVEFQTLSIDPEYRVNRDRISDLLSKQNRLLDSINEIMVMGDLPVPRTTYVLDRGSYSKPTQKVSPDVPGAIKVPFHDLPPNRLGLARWLVHPDHPLTARVFVNRIWQQHFGQGLVATPEDFGLQGELPSHPELLDYLARDFIASGWNIKALHRLIMTSKTYQLSSAVDSISYEIDPKNRWLWRGPTQRLTAEMLRDNALALSSLLVRQQGGPSVYPYQPEGLWDELSNKSWRYPYLQSDGEGLYRRSLYTIWKRTSPPPSMLLFDVPDRSFCAVQRKQTNTPLQALALLNDPQYIESARVLAERMIRQNGQETARLKNIFRLAVGRHPDELEMTALLEFYQQEKLKAAEKEGEMEKYLSIGEWRASIDLPEDELAALAITIHNLLNTYEAQMKL